MGTERTPPTPPRRVPGLDVVRGIAIIGTLVSNIWLFTAFSGTPVIDPRWRDLLQTMPSGKFLGLLTIVFGIGLEIQRQAAVRRGRRWPGAYLVRLALLFIDGVLNYIFLVQFDVLRAYALVGSVVVFVLLLPERWQWVFVWTALTAHLSLLVLIEFVPTILDAAPSFVLSGEFPVFEGRPSYGQTVVMAGLTVFSDLTLGSDTGSIISLGLFAFTCGALLYRRGLFDGRGTRLRVGLMLGGLGLGVPLDIAFHSLAPERAFERFSSSTLVAFGILALTAHLYHGREVGFVGRRLSSVGRMALSCYVLQNLLGRIAQELVLGSPISGRVDPVLGTVTAFAVIALVLIIFAEMWLRVFRRGPLEAVWDAAFRISTRERGAGRQQAQA